MSIPKEFKYESEDDFVQRLLIPLLHRLGFNVVVNYHGRQEYGKDLVFAQIDRFGHVCYYGLQAKYEPSIGLSAIESLITDCRQAFANPFTHPHTGSEERIQVFYAVNGGSISDEASGHFFNSLAHPYGACLRLLDGKAVLALDRWATMNAANSVLPSLTGLAMEIRFNRGRADFIRRSIEEVIAGDLSKTPAVLLRTVALAAFMAQPVLPASEFTGRVSTYLDKAEMINVGIDLMLQAARTRQTLLDIPRNTLAFVVELQGQAEGLERELADLLSSLGTLIPAR